jgi:Acetoacetate decarboxylase (ADC)
VASYPLGHPAAPWRLQGQLWLSLFRVTGAADRFGRPDGLYGAAFVSYEPGSDLTYSELLVARPVRAGKRPRVSVTDIWVDSPVSMAGGRELWAIPKELCDFSLDTGHAGPLSRTEWAASAERRPIARARFTDLSRAGVRLPFRAGLWQPGIDGGGPRTASLKGSSRTLPCRGRWQFATDGPLGWLAGRRPVASFRTTDFRLSFG